MLIVQTDTFLLNPHGHGTNRSLFKSIPTLIHDTNFFNQPYALGTNSHFSTQIPHLWYKHADTFELNPHVGGTTPCSWYISTLLVLTPSTPAGGADSNDVHLDRIETCGPRLSLNNIRSWNESPNSVVQRLFESMVLLSWST